MLTHRYSPDTLPEPILSLIESQARADAMHNAAEALTGLAVSYLESREKPTRLSLHSLDEALAAAREHGLADRALNQFLAALDGYVNAHLRGCGQ